MKSDVDHWIDGAGHPIDQEIKETVIVLNLLGIETVASCGGHLDRNLYPWVDLQMYPPEIKKMVHEFGQLQAQLDDAACLEPESIRKKHFLLGEAIKAAQMKYLESINTLLNQFYATRSISYDRCLIVSLGPCARLHNVGSDRQEIRSKEEQSRKLTEYQEEMKAFTTFLKQKFMNSK